jgi:pimeloyl-ACP methyl ester carboxylesterase
MLTRMFSTSAGGIDMGQRRRIWAIVALFALAARPVQAATLDGQWQGKFRAGDAEFRLVLQFYEEKARLQCRVFKLDDGPSPEEQRCSALAVNGGAVQYTTELGDTFQGALSSDGKRLIGAYVYDPTPLPVEFRRASISDHWTVDPTVHQVRFISTNDGNKLEVLDYGGEGPPILLLAGLNWSGHVFDGFAKQLLPNHHVYAFSRRGFGGSSRPEPFTENYSSDRLGEDVLEVIQALQLDRPLLAGWSIAGQELSWMATRHPEKVRGLVYLDAAYAYSFYAPGNLIGDQNGNLMLDANDLRRKMIALKEPISPADGLAAVDQMLKSDIPQLQADLLAMQAEYRRRIADQAPAQPAFPMTPRMHVNYAVMWGAENKYPPLRVPVLAFFATDPPLQANASGPEKKDWEQSNLAQAALIQRFRVGNPDARIVELKGANHAVFLSNELEVARELNAFLDGMR